MTTSRPRPILVDTDPGVDDLIAILFVLSLPDLFDLRGLTTIFGNVSVDQATINTQRILDAAGHPDIPVASGADRPLLERPIMFPAVVHGENGLGDAELAPPSRSAIATPAAQFIYDTAAAAPGELVIAAIGPLTNLALAVKLYPDLVSLVSELVIMGGNAFGAGNASAAGEANIHKDPEAAEIVFNQDWAITMAGLDITDRSCLTPDQLRQIGEGTHPANQLLAAATPYYQQFYEMAVPGFSGLRPHDVIPLIWLIHPEWFESVELPIAVGLEGIGRGKTWPAIPFQITPGSPWDQRRSTRILTNGDLDAMADLVTNQLTDWTVQSR